MPTTQTLQAMLFAGVGLVLGLAGVMDSPMTAIFSGTIMGVVSGLMVRGSFYYCLALVVVYVGFAVIGGSIV